MLKMSSRDLGKYALVMLQYKIAKSGVDLRPTEFDEKITREAQRINCPREELLAFYRRFLIPEVLKVCKLDLKPEHTTPSEREGEISYRLLRLLYFWNLNGLRKEVRCISDSTPLDFEQVAAITLDIVSHHIKMQFGEGEHVKLELLDNPGWI
jgi:hypothetical protein